MRRPERVYAVLIEADVAELADALGSGPNSFTGVGVQVPSSVPVVTT